MDGVSTYLALTFGTLLSSQGTDASFETISPVSPDVCPFGVSNLTTVISVIRNRPHLDAHDQRTGNQRGVGSVALAVGAGQAYDSTAARATEANRFCSGAVRQCHVRSPTRDDGG